MRALHGGTAKDDDCLATYATATPSASVVPSHLLLKYLKYHVNTVVILSTRMQLSETNLTALPASWLAVTHYQYVNDQCELNASSYAPQ